jgi:hypothetical protein
LTTGSRETPCGIAEADARHLDRATAVTLSLDGETTAIDVAIAHRVDIVEREDERAKGRRFVGRKTAVQGLAVVLGGDAVGLRQAGAGRVEAQVVLSPGDIGATGIHDHAYPNLVAFGLAALQLELDGRRRRSEEQRQDDAGSGAELEGRENLEHRGLLGSTR